MDGVSEGAGMNRPEPESEKLTPLSIKISRSTSILHSSARPFATFAPCGSNSCHLGDLTSGILFPTFLSPAVLPQSAIR